MGRSPPTKWRPPLSDSVPTILITGSEGMLGRALRPAFEARGVRVLGLDLAATGVERGDIRDPDRMRAATAACDGVVHLAAVSRVARAERDPALCHSVNVDGFGTVLTVAAGRRSPPWVVFASSREVYGQPDMLPAGEDAPLRPLNEYGRSKVAGERLVEAARADGLRAASVRLSNVYGSPHDHADRVVPAFAAAARRGVALQVHGAERTFDFTHVDDTVRGVVGLCELLLSGAEPPPPIHLLTGVETSLGELAALCLEQAGGGQLVSRRASSHEVTRFVGDTSRAATLLGWRATVGLAEGLRPMTLSPPPAPACT